MRQRFNTGSSPVREALSRLLSEGFVSLEKHKGFRVAPVSRKELSELVKARAWIDGIAVAESIRSLDRIWEETLVVTLHRLSRATRDGPDGHAANWEALHKAFHVALVSGCGSSWITQISERLFDAAERYRMLGSAHVPARNELEEHQAIVDACFRRDVDRAVELLGQHYQQTFDVFVGPSEP
jgi:DNA-binding GntR family transcriptional regulator